MHEDIDDFEPNMGSYYKMHPDERRQRNRKYNWYLRYADGKISYEKYLLGLEDFREVLDSDELIELKKFYAERKRKREAEEERKALKEFQKHQNREEAQKIFGYIFLIIMALVFLYALHEN